MGFNLGWVRPCALNACSSLWPLHSRMDVAAIVIEWRGETGESSVVLSASSSSHVVFDNWLSQRSGRYGS
jgi:hypothetical protein